MQPRILRMKKLPFTVINYKAIITNGLNGQRKQKKDIQTLIKGNTFLLLKLRMFMILKVKLPALNLLFYHHGILQ